MMIDIKKKIFILQNGWIFKKDDKCGINIQKNIKEILLIKEMKEINNQTIQNESKKRKLIKKGIR